MRRGTKEIMGKQAETIGPLTLALLYLDEEIWRLAEAVD